MTSIAAAVAVALSVPMVLLVMSNEQVAIIDELRVETLSTAIRLASIDRDDWMSVVADVPSRPEERVVVVDTQLRLIADSEAAAIDTTFERPEIVQALGGTLASDVRYSSTLATDLRYVAAPVVQNGRVVAAVRFSLPEDIIVNTVQRTAAALVVFIIAVMFMSGLIAVLIARSIGDPVRRLARVARDLSGDLSLRADTVHGLVEVRAVAEALNATAARLQELLARSERVAADASHHLRTPLTGIRLRLEAISDLTTVPELRDEAEHAIAEVDRLNHRIDQVLALARADAGSAPRMPVDVTDIVADRLAHFGPAAASRDLELVPALAAHCITIADAGAVPRIVDELLGNARLYAATRIEVTLTRVDGALELVVADDGPGVPDAELPLIFQRFRRGSASVPGGTGLGLALVRETAEANGGSAWGERASLGGLAVHVRLPDHERPQT